jgi:isoquinoline 1-oxidoreductase subunit alpha
MISLNVNQKSYQVDVDPNMPLLWVIRDVIGLTGTKYGCGVAQCGACVLHLNGDHPLQLTWQEIDVPQCGYCHSGQLMSAAVLLRENPNPTDKDIDDAMSGNICRCGTYLRIRKAIHMAAEMQQKGVKHG